MVNFEYDKVSKIITIPDTQDSVTIQALIDDIRDFEDELHNMETYKIADASGKQDLGGGTAVGITLTLIDWKLKFADRPGPDYVLCSVSGGNLVRYDTTTQTYGNPIEPSEYVTVSLTASSSATISTVELEELNYNGSVFIDSVGGTSGTTYPIGTMASPVDNISDARTIADSYGIEVFHIHGSVTLDTNYDSFIFVSDSPAKGTIDLNGQSVEGCVFKEITITGTQNGYIQADKCKINGVINMEGEYRECIIESNINCKSGAWTYVWEGRTTGAELLYVDMNGTAKCALSVSGNICVQNMTDTSSVFLKEGAGRVTGDNTNTAGTIMVTGECIWEDSGVGDGVVVTNDTARAVIWDEQLSKHTDSGSAGKALADAGAGTNPWDVAVSGHTSAGTFGELVFKIKKWVGWLRSLL